MHGLPLVTIVTPSYNQGQFIRATIESVLSQDYPNVEYIIMDGASKDHTADVAAEYADRLTFISEKDRGQSHAINKGFQIANGEIIAWLNSDDIFLPGAIRNAVQALMHDPELGAVYGDGYQIDREGNVISRFAVTQQFDLWKLVNLSDYILQQTVFFRRSVFDHVGWIDEDLHYGMDWEILMRIGRTHPLRYIPFEMGSIREYGEAKTSSGGLKRVRELRAIMERHSGKRWAPGYFVYALPVYRQMWLQTVEELVPPGWFRTKVERAIVRTLNWFVGRVVSRAQGWYADAWVSGRAYFMLQPSRGRYVALDLELPAWVPFEQQTITVKVGHHVVARESFGHGAFTLFLHVDPQLVEQSLTFTATAKHTFIPRVVAGSNDGRRLAYLLREVRYVSPTVV